MTELITIVVPTYRRAATLAATLAALDRLDPSPLEVIVVDDAHDEGTRNAVERSTAHSGRVTLLRVDRHGAAAARNAGARAAQGDLLLFCDDDMILAPGHLAQHLETHREYGDRVVVGGERWYSPAALAALERTPFGRYRIELERRFTVPARNHRHGGPRFDVRTLPSYDLSIRRELFWQLGGFDEEFPFAGAEDQDLSRRATTAGVRLIRNREIKLLHNDPVVSLRQFCEREERGAHTVVALVRKYPDMLGEFSRNDPISRSDPLALKVNKLAKFGLSRTPVLRCLDALVSLIERLGLGDGRLWPLYRALIGLHIFRGYRDAASERGLVVR